ncbi:unnamed protein product, partial [Nesidiocoris tenuis]
MPPEETFHDEARIIDPTWTWSAVIMNKENGPSTALRDCLRWKVSQENRKLRWKIAGREVEIGR